jgi:hypothetical protein
MSARYGVRWPDGSITGAITDSARLAGAYAKDHGGAVYTADACGDPIDACRCERVPTAYEVEVNACGICQLPIHRHVNGEECAA